MGFWFSAHGQQILNFIAYALTETRGEKWQPGDGAVRLSRIKHPEQSNPFKEVSLSYGYSPPFYAGRRATGRPSGEACGST